VTPVEPDPERGKPVAAVKVRPVRKHIAPMLKDRGTPTAAMSGAISVLVGICLSTLYKGCER